jgi:MOSC domain-containing protein YiiM
VGDWFRIGSAEFVVTEPRLPCYKLGIKMGRDEFVAEFLERGLLGFYLAVAKEGEIGPGDEIVALSRDPKNLDCKRRRAIVEYTLAWRFG